MGRQTDTGEVDPVRAIPADHAWLSLLYSKLSDEGVLVMNFESARNLSESVYRKFMKPGRGFAAGYRFSCSQYENTIAAFLKKPLTPRQFINNLRQFEELDQRRNACQLKFFYRKLWIKMTLQSFN